MIGKEKPKFSHLGNVEKTGKKPEVSMNWTSNFQDSNLTKLFSRALASTKQKRWWLVGFRRVGVHHHMLQVSPSLLLPPSTGAPPNASDLMVSFPDSVTEQSQQRTESPSWFIVSLQQQWWAPPPSHNQFSSEEIKKLFSWNQQNVQQILPTSALTTDNYTHINCITR